MQKVHILEKEKRKSGRETAKHTFFFHSLMCEQERETYKTIFFFSRSVAVTSLLVKFFYINLKD
jgi:hypothetical protein